MKKSKQDLVIIGGGIMGLMTAYYASFRSKKIVILEKLYIGNKKASSFSYTRSMRNDYLDPTYAKLAYEAQRLWKELQEMTDEQFIFNCGCLNLVKKAITSDVSTTYASKSYKNLKSLGMNTKKYNKKQLNKIFPQFNVDLGCLDVEAGVLYLPPITKLLLKILAKKNIKINENVKIVSIEENKNGVSIKTNQGNLETKKLSINAGRWVNDVLEKIKKCTIRFPITPDRPSQCKYYIPKKNIIGSFNQEKLPVFAYLDIGIYGHPILIGKTKGVKIGYFNPVDIKRVNTKINNIETFVKECMPSLSEAKVVDVKDADQCYYDIVSDDEFILGMLPGYKNIVVGTGWRGTGYKFAPLIGKILMELNLQKGTIYDINRFSPNRFFK